MSSSTSNSNNITNNTNNSNDDDNMTIENAFMIPGLKKLREKERKLGKHRKGKAGTKRKLNAMEALNVEAKEAYYVLAGPGSPIKPHSGQVLSKDKAGSLITLFYSKLLEAVNERNISLDDYAPEYAPQKMKEVVIDEFVKHLILKDCCSLLLINQKVGEEVYDHFQNTGEILDKEAEMNERRRINAAMNQGPGGGKYFRKIPIKKYKDLMETVDKMIEEYGVRLNADDILKKFKDHHHLDIKKNYLNLWLREQGYKWNEKKDVGGSNGLKLSPERVLRIRKFLIEYCEALKFCNLNHDNNNILKNYYSNDYVMVYLDESYVNTQHFNWKRGGLTNQDRGKSPTTPNSERGGGVRFVLVHAMTIDGLLVPPRPIEYLPEEEQDNEDLLWRHEENDTNAETEQDKRLAFRWHHPLIPTNDPEVKPSEPKKAFVCRLDQEIPSAEMIFAATTGSKDYHHNMNGEIFEAYVVTHLIPAFKKKYGDKKMILVLDNARYHHGKDEAFFSVNDKTKWNRRKLQAEFEHYQINQIKVQM